jgi:tetratricopeptide (TPR) repeat protein
MIVVDHDIDLRDAELVQWAMTYRVRPERDISIRGGRMAALDPSYNDLDIRLAALRLHAGRYEDADSLLRRRLLRAGERSGIFWHYTLLRLNQGRFAEALAFADSFRVAAGNTINHGYLRVIVLLTAQRGTEAAALVDSIARSPFPYAVQSRLGRDMAMNRTHAAEAQLLRGDRARLRSLEDSVQAWGQLSGYLRDRIMHHHVRGLRHIAEGDYERAAAELSRAQFGPRSGGYGRTNLHLARVLLAAGRAEEALRPLRLNLAAGIGADQTWASRAEARELLGFAHDRLGHADSARTHYEAVLHAWRAADPGLAARKRAIAHNLARLRAQD